MVFSHYTLQPPFQQSSILVYFFGMDIELFQNTIALEHNCSRILFQNNVIPYI